VWHNVEALGHFNVARQLLVAGRSRLFRVAVDEPPALPSDGEEPAAEHAAQLESAVRYFDFQSDGPPPSSICPSKCKVSLRPDQVKADRIARCCSKTYPKST